MKELWMSAAFKFMLFHHASCKQHVHLALSRQTAANKPKEIQHSILEEID
jgi:hypothetical protein